MLAAVILRYAGVSRKSRLLWLAHSRSQDCMLPRLCRSLLPLHTCHWR